MKSLISLWSCMANELAVRCCTSATRDITTVARRTEHEGLSFLAITLADFGKAIQKWLDQGFVVPSDCPSFKKGSRSGLPVFLRGFLERVFDPVSGVLLEDPDIDAIIAIRQLTLFVGKIGLPLDPREGNQSRAVVSPRRERLAMAEFIQCENEVKVSDSLLDPQYLAEFKEMSNMLFSDLFSKIDRDIYWGRHCGKHGPGAVADKLSSNGKWNLRTWPARLQRVFPAEEFLIPNLHFREELVQELDFVEPGDEMPVRVITVPKTLKSPRVIAIEPTAMQFAQQSILALIRSAIFEDGFLSSAIGLDDQVPNQELARLGSLSGDLATLDLSEASDRVSNQHVRVMMEDFPHLHEAVQSSRSRKADVPGHGVIRLAKFASMGSALCFPVEAMVFLTVIFLGIQRELNTSLTHAEILSLRGKVRVFGDDIIVPRDYVLSVVDELSAFGHKVNVDKSFWTGRFRESCGKEYFDGHDVSIVRIREVLPTQRQNAAGVNSAVKLRNLAYWHGLWKTASWLDDYLVKLLRVFPNVAPTSPLLGRESVLGYQFQRLHPNHQSPLTRGYYLVAKPPLDHLEGVGALAKCLNMVSPSIENKFLELREDRPMVIVDSNDNEHLERSGRPKRVNIMLGWRPPF
ncbi:TPA_asm: RNA-directed RNA polymerase [ssRNA phage Zoerhiza.2_3]|uniref:RNA-directed RNA polymerase n=2 Tax=Leviviricetes TaxID=2842243 RepID=A0A8S5KZE5_9VIRU|nr:RNA-directed RNA polymerase [ssRNA phage Zoerhiza.2_3]QDH86562.1 MAG: RNA-dependent RNA polymerase [Leviviridae sp.]DAD50218.1 TPA_asm: RNA-directed RNA polymerase [ssRNA phage Zoerhiza.2_3]